MALALVAGLAIGYVSGSLAWGLWIPRVARGIDVRTLGSGNLGATNVYRTLGPPLGITVLLLDVAKGAVPVWLVPALPVAAAFPGGAEWCRLAVGSAAVLGHVFTMFAGFKGGKGVATAGGVLLALAPLPCLVCVLVFVATVAITRFISVGSMLSATAFPVTLAFTPGGARTPTFVFGVLLALLVIARHQDNIRRLLRGEERRFSLKGGSA